MLTVLDLFSGIGGFSLGLERTGGFKTVAFCEIDPFCRKVLAKHWPSVPIHKDVTKLRGEDVGPVDVICGGFPCQDISTAGRGEGIEGSRSGLWKEFARLIGEIRPRYVIVENVSALLHRGLDAVLGDLSEIGYDAEWHCIPASAVGAPHRRDRVWIIAYPQHPDADDAGPYRAGVHKHGSTQSADEQERFPGSLGAVPSDPNSPPMQRQAQQRSEPDGDHAGAGDVAKTGRNGNGIAPAHSGKDELADADLSRLERRNGTELSECASQRLAWPGGSWRRDDHWRLEPDVGRVAHGVPQRVDRLRSLGNAVVPQIVEMIGHAILTSQPARD